MCTYSYFTPGANLQQVVGGHEDIDCLGRSLQLWAYGTSTLVPRLLGWEGYKSSCILITRYYSFPGKVTEQHLLSTMSSARLRHLPSLLAAFP